MVGRGDCSNRLYFIQRIPCTASQEKKQEKHLDLNQDIRIMSSRGSSVPRDSPPGDMDRSKPGTKQLFATGVMVIQQLSTVDSLLSGAVHEILHFGKSSASRDGATGTLIPVLEQKDTVLPMTPTSASVTQDSVALQSSVPEESRQRSGKKLGDAVTSDHKNIQQSVPETTTEAHSTQIQRRELADPVAGQSHGEMELTVPSELQHHNKLPRSRNLNEHELQSVESAASLSVSDYMKILCYEVLHGNCNTSKIIKIWKELESTNFGEKYQESRLWSFLLCISLRILM
nr:PREDICTED: uncharacterized protein LOC102354736 [Latimeria chalumnae]|eukprot:XP_014351923.1 PREDICTED: uncharacterized protein LOC102354736 [Latimeria chalumnae]